MATENTGDLTTRVLVEIRDAIREQGVDIRGLRSDVNELRTDVNGLRTDVTGLRSDVNEIKGELVEVKAELRGMGVTVTQVLRAVEHGNARRDGDVADHETRIRRLEEHAGLQP